MKNQREACENPQKMEKKKESKEFDKKLSMADGSGVESQNPKRRTFPKTKTMVSVLVRSDSRQTIHANHQKPKANCS